MADRTVSAAMAGLTMSCGRLTAGRTFSCGRRMAGPTEVSLFCGRLMAGRTFSCGRLTAGLTEVSPIRLNLSSHLWAPNGWPHLLLWAPDGWPHGGSHTHQSIVPSTPTYLLLVRSDRRLEVSVRLGGGGLVLEPFPPSPMPPLPLFPSRPATSNSLRGLQLECPL